MSGNYKKLLDEGRILCPYVRSSFENLDNEYYGMSRKERRVYNSIHKKDSMPSETFLKITEFIVAGLVGSVVLPIMVLGFVGLFGFLIA